MNRTFAIVATVVLVLAAAAAIGIGAYNAGVAHGIAESGRAIAVPAPTAETPYVYAYPRPWHGFGFFPFFPFLFVLFFFFALRAIWWRGYRRGPWRGGWRYDDGGVPPAFDEWHRRAHARQEPEGKS